MAEVLIYLIIGMTIGWFIRRLTERRVVAKAIVDGLAAEWAEHTTAHLKAQEGSVVMTTPGALPTSIFPAFDGRRTQIAFPSLDVQILEAVERLGAGAYGVSIMDEISTRSGHEISYGALHVALDRLSRAGLLTSTMGESTAERAGCRKRYFELTDRGKLSLVSARHVA